MRVEIRLTDKVFSAELTDDILKNTRAALNLIRSIDYFEDKHYIVDKIASQYELNLRNFDLNFRPLNLDEVAKMSRFPGIEIGSHSHTHPILTAIDSQQCLNELVISKKLLENWTGKEVTHFCYPEGYGNKKIIELLKDTGYLTGSTTKNALLEPYSASEWPYLIPRFGCPNGPSYLLSGKFLNLGKYLDTLSKFKNSFRRHQIEE